MKNMRFFRLATFIITFGKLFHSRARSPSSARLDFGRRFLPTMRQGNLPIEPYEILVNVLKTLSSLGLHAKKKEQLRYFKIVYSLANSWTVL